MFIDEGRLTEEIFDSEKSRSNFLDYLRNEVKNDGIARLNAMSCSKFVEKLINCDLISDLLLSKHTYRGKLKSLIELRFTSKLYLHCECELLSIDKLFSEYRRILNVLHIANQIRYTNITTGSFNQQLV